MSDFLDPNNPLLFNQNFDNVNPLPQQPQQIDFNNDASVFQETVQDNNFDFDIAINDILDVFYQTEQEFEEGEAYNTEGVQQTYNPQGTQKAGQQEFNSLVVQGADLAYQAAQGLIEKYNLDIDLENASNEELDMLYKIQFIDSIPDSKEEAEQFFNTLGTIDHGYDALKEVFPGLNQNDIEGFIQKEQNKKEILINCVKNGGTITLGDSNSDSSISKESYLDYAKDVLTSMASTDEMIQYATENLGISEEDARKCLESAKIFVSIPYDIGGGRIDYNNPDTIKKVNEEFANYLVNSANIEAGELSFEDLYKAFYGAEYNEEAIADLNSMTPIYNEAVSVVQEALETQKALKGKTPDEALEYFKQVAGERNDGTTGAQLFNEYYAQVIEYANSIEPSPLIVNAGFMGTDLKLNSMTVDEEGNIVQTFSYAGNPEFGSAEDLCEFFPDFFSYDKETGLITRTYTTDYDKYSEDMPIAAPIDERIFSQINYAITENNLALKVKQNEFNEQFKDILSDENGEPFDMFSYVMLTYPEMKHDALGVNVVESKFSEYVKDMTSYPEKFSETVSKAGFVLSWVPGMQWAGILSLAGKFSDNVIDGINICTSSREDKAEKLGELFLNTAVEGLETLAGYKINEIAHRFGGFVAAKYLTNANNPSANLTRFIGTAAEYGFDVGLSMGWDTMSFALRNGRLPEGEEWSRLAVSNLIFNAADLRAGMALYRAVHKPDSPIDIGGGKTITYNNDGSVTYKCNDYSETISSDSTVRTTSLADGSKVVAVQSGDNNSIYSIDSKGNISVPETIAQTYKRQNVDINEAVKGAEKLGILEYNADGTINFKSVGDFLNTYSINEYQKIAYLGKTYPELEPKDLRRLQSTFETVDEMKLYADDIDVWIKNKDIYLDWAKALKDQGAAEISNTGILIRQAAGLDDIEGAKISSRSKGVESIYDKISRKVLKGAKVSDFDAASEKVDDLLGTRIILDDSEIESAHIIAQNLARAIDEGKIEIGEIHNYSNGSQKYWSQEDVDLILAASARKGKKVKYAQEEKSNSGYVCAQVNIRTLTDGVEGGRGELQIRSVSMDKNGELEHIFYDITRGKNIGKDIPELENLYTPVKKAIYMLEREGLKDDYLEYVRNNYRYVRNYELGNIEGEFQLPKLPDNLSRFNILSWESLEVINTQAHTIKQKYNIP